MGIPANVAWQMTFREIGLYAEAFNTQERVRWRQGVTLAHLTAALMRTDPDKFPTLDSLLEPLDDETPEQKHARIWATVQQFARPGELGFYKPSKGKKKRKK